MKLEQQTQISSPPKIKKLEQGRTTLPLELLVDVFRTINTYSDGFPTDLALDTDIAIIKTKQQELWTQCKCKKKASSKLPQCCRVCGRMGPCVTFQDLIVCFPCRTFFRYYAGRGGQLKSCKRSKHCARLGALRDCQECRWDKCISLKLDPLKVDVKKRGNVAEFINPWIDPWILVRFVDFTAIRRMTFNLP
uniref:Nuclear receptor domain-containing protein n=1 Tax=Meloidogyne javanica TaxID=6303 RepID=A0A915NBY2_MELJA